MKNLFIRKELIEHNIRLYEAAEKLKVSKGTLRTWMETEWPEELQKEFADFFTGNSNNEAVDLRRKMAVFRSRRYGSIGGDPGGYAARVLAEVQERELRREKEREGWY